jgi:hypothetical protein
MVSARSVVASEENLMGDASGEGRHAAATRQSTVPRRGGGRSSDRPAPAVVVAALAVVALAVPAWMLSDELRNFNLLGDDFVYIAQARDWPTTAAHLWEPHNAHLVPLFRLWTFSLVAASPRLEYLPAVLAVAAYFGLVAAMIAVGFLVARETGRTGAGLTAMAVLGISTVTHPAVTWYSAGQALWAASASVATVALARHWSRKGGAPRLAAVIVGSVVAPAIWSGGLVAGPAAVAYLLATKRPSTGRSVLLLFCSTLCVGLLVLATSWRQFGVNKKLSENIISLCSRPIAAVGHSAQALVEDCGFGNLGIDAVTTPWQAAALLVVMAVLYAKSRGGLLQINPLEAAGATIAAGSCFLTYTLRGNLPYSSLRGLGWYHAMPQVGAILFAAGWWKALEAPEPGRINLRQAAGVLGLVVVFSLIQVPRGDKQQVDSAPAFSPSEASSFPTPALRLVRARYYKAESHRLQVRALARLDRVDGILSRLGASPEALRDLVGRVLIPGMVETAVDCDAVSLLKPRAQKANAQTALSAHRTELIELMRPEPPFVPFWLDPHDRLSRSVRAISAVPDQTPSHVKPKEAGQ